MNTPALTRRTQRGATVLGLVLMLAFVASLAAAHAVQSQRADIRTVAHQQRAAQAFAAAEAGADWAVLMLGQGRVDAQCRPSDDAVHGTFRARHLTQDANGRLHATAARAACVMADGGWRCACDGGAVRALADAEAPGFSLGLVDDDVGGAPGAVQLQVRGCAVAHADCLQSRAGGDGVAMVTRLLARLSALPGMPSAAVTTGGAFDPGGGGTRLVNADGDGPGLAVAAGGEVTARDDAQLVGRPGSPPETALLARHAGLASQSMFTALFGLDRASHRAQPALLRVVCDADDCSAALQHAAHANPGRVLWVAGDLRLRAPVALGTPQLPVLLSIDGALHTDADFQLRGLLHLSGERWQHSAGHAQVHGAVVADTVLALTGAPTITYDAAVLHHLQQRQGSLVPVAGGWRDRPTMP